MYKSDKELSRDAVHIWLESHPQAMPRPPEDAPLTKSGEKRVPNLVEDDVYSYVAVACAEVRHRQTRERKFIFAVNKNQAFTIRDKHSEIGMARLGRLLGYDRVSPQICSRVEGFQGPEGDHSEIILLHYLSLTKDPKRTKAVLTFPSQWDLVRIAPSRPSCDENSQPAYRNYCKAKVQERYPKARFIEPVHEITRSMWLGKREVKGHLEKGA